MPALRTDLLSNTRTLLRAATLVDIGMIALLAFILVGLLIGDPSRMTIAAASTVPPEGRVFAARVGVAGALLCCILVVPLLRQMLRIVDSAQAGDPFVPENGERLQRIGWLLLTINIVANITLSVALTKGVKLPPVNFTVVLTVLMIFVLARIFEAGSRMRAELQETV